MTAAGMTLQRQLEDVTGEPFKRRRWTARELLHAIIENADLVGSGEGRDRLAVALPHEVFDQLVEWEAAAEIDEIDWGRS